LTFTNVIRCTARRFFSTSATGELSKELEPLSIYIHWPFCRDICPYCDFNRYKRDEIDHKSMNDTYLRIIDHMFSQNSIFEKRKLRSIFFGGGTPSTAHPQTFFNIIDRIHKYIPAYRDVEITMEANPTSIESKKLVQFKDAGINRISIGVQSFDERDLIFLGRKHSVDEAINAVLEAQRIIGNDRVSLDLIFGTALHARDPQVWERVLKKALDLETHHISLYQLTIEKNTKFYHKYMKGDFVLPNEQVQENLYDISIQMCKDKNLNQYEVSNFAKPNAESKHNIQYWKSRDFIGIGPGAHSRITLNDNKRFAFVQVMQPEQWIQDSMNDAKYLLGTIKMDQLSERVRLEELFLMGLRLVDQGVTASAVKHHTNVQDDNPFPLVLNRNVLEMLIQEGFLKYERRQDLHLMCTPKGVKLLNQICEMIL
jgi:putative oxygen-independent coproporphyrinogen III oxidase